MLSKKMLEDLKKVSAQLGVDYQQLVKAVEGTEKKDNKKVNSEDIKSQEKKIDELMKRFHDLKKYEDVEVDIEEQVENIECIQRSLRELKRDGYIQDYEGDEGDENTRKEED